jgi:hypothetical protein
MHPLLISIDLAVRSKDGVWLKLVIDGLYRGA